MRELALILVFAGCVEDKACRQGTLLLQLAWKSGSVAADQLDVTVTVDSVDKRTMLPVSGATGNLEIDFPAGYPAGKSVMVNVIASANAMPVGMGSAALTLPKGCGKLSLVLDLLPAGADLPMVLGDAGDDGGGGDAAVGDAAPTMNDLAPASCPGCPLLTALHPAIANTGDTIYLEGSFGPTVTVHFPGGANVVASVLGSGRATVVVPASATAGDLTVGTSGATTNALPFRRASFPLALSTFSTRYEQSESAHRTTSMTFGRCHGGALLSHGYVYITGGSSPGKSANVERALVNADGTLGVFVNEGVSPPPLPNTVNDTVVIGNSLYALGDRATHIMRAPIAADGSLGAFADTGQSTVYPQGAGSPVVIGDYLYLLGGGQEGPSPVTQIAVTRARILADGTLGPFADAGVTLATGRRSAPTAVIGSYVYIFGGYIPNGIDFTTATNDYERAAINPDGTLGAFASAGSFVQARSSMPVVAMGGSLYILGGFSAGDLNTVERATINADGTLGAFSVVSEVRLSRLHSDIESSGIVIGNYLYLIGGNCGSFRTFERGSIFGGSGLGSFTPVSPLVTPRKGHRMAVLGNHVYAFGGADASNLPLASIEEADVAPDGTLSSFHTLAQTLTQPRDDSQQDANLGDAYYLMAGGPSMNERAPIAPDGTLGPFAAVSGSIPSPGPMVIADNHLYVIAGGGRGDVQRAAIDDAGVGDFTPLEGVGLNVARKEARLLVAGQYLTVLGGVEDGGAGNSLTSVEQSLLDADGGLGAFGLADGGLATGRALPGVSLLGNTLFVLGGQQLGSGGQSSVERAAIAVDGKLAGTFGPGGVTLPNAMVDITPLVLGNFVYIIGGRASGVAFSQVYSAPLQ